MDAAPLNPPPASRIIGIGIDLVENERIAGSITRLGDRFLERVFTEGEIGYCKKMRHPAPHYAVRFAAKEAVAKAFGCGIGEQLSWLDIEVTRSDAGVPALVLHGRGRELATARGVEQILLSLSHTEHYSTANVLLAGR
ncbi:MAG: holo-ACP synthase [Verrucomicrobiota bacterium]